MSRPQGGAVSTAWRGVAHERERTGAGVGWQMAVPLFNSLQLNDLGTRRDRCGQQSVGFRLALGSISLCVGIGCHDRDIGLRRERGTFVGNRLDDLVAD